ncbi:MAG: outer membrane protein assembly factor BamC [Burkholderiaceae bacterium]|nr:outer membrane protein assembly factor BamC [Roseateles sp.]MBV8471044.1 outer membrane protein assembly factor BamC [Burkholderiaceae bacterium]
MSSVTRSLNAPTKTLTYSLAGSLVLVSLTACSTIEGWLGAEKTDYHDAAKQNAPLDVPPDLTQLAKDSRTQVQGGVISASAMQQQGNKLVLPQARPNAAGPNQVALDNAGELKLVRLDNERWLHSSLTPEQLWPQVQAFWISRGFAIESEQPEIGMMETNWLEDRSKLPQDFFRKALGRLVDGLYSSGLRDKYRTRIERAPGGGTDIFVSHRGAAEVYTSSQRDTTDWQPRPSDPGLEAEMLSRMMLKLGGKQDELDAARLASAASAASAANAPAPAVAAVDPVDLDSKKELAKVPDSLAVTDDFERAWRRVGQSLDRHGFTVEDRDRKQGLFFLRYADPTQAGKEEPGFFARLFGKDKASTAERYRVSVAADGKHSVVKVLNSQGQQVTDENAKRILRLLMEDLR